MVQVGILMSYVIAFPPFRTTGVGDSIRETGLMKIPRQSFAEAACLYQNDSGKAMVFSSLEIGRSRWKPEVSLLDLRGFLWCLVGNRLEKSPSASLRSTVSLQCTKGVSLRL